MLALGFDPHLQGALHTTVCNVRECEELTGLLGVALAA